MCIFNIVYVFLSAFPFPSENDVNKITSSCKGFHIVYFSLLLGILSSYFLFLYCPNEQPPVLYKQNKGKKVHLLQPLALNIHH